MNHQAIIEQLSVLAPQLKAASSPESVLVKYASDRNLSAAQLERIGQVYNIAKTLNFMDKSANRGDSFKVLDTQKMLSDYTAFKPKENKQANRNDDWNCWFDSPGIKEKAASESKNPEDINSWLDFEKSAKIVEENGEYVVYSEDGSKKLSKPGSLDDAKKRLKQVEYFKSHKKANTVPNILGMANNSNYTDVEYNTESLPKTAFAIIKEELRNESSMRFELESAKQVMDDSAEEVRKIASELLEMHRISTLPYADMERDAVFSSNDPDSIKSASDLIANYISQKGFNLSRNDFSKPAPRIVRDKFSALPLFKSAAEHIGLYKAAESYINDLELKIKSAAGAATASGKSKKEKNVEDEGAGDNVDDRLTGKAPERGNNRNTDSKPTNVESDNKPPPSAKKNTPREDSGGGGGAGRGGQMFAGYGNASKDIAKGIIDMYSASNYINKPTSDFLGNVFKTPTFSSKNTRQQGIDNAVTDTGRLADLQRLLLTDPIIGEADQDTVVSLYNTLAKANPEVVKDRNLLRFALREALQYDAVPLHTYKDLISMGKDRVDTENKQMEIDSKRYSI